MQEVPLITKFVELQKAVEKQISRGNSEKAKQAYSKLLAHYRTLSESSIVDIHKSIAYDQATRVYGKIAAMKTSSAIPEKIAPAAPHAAKVSGSSELEVAKQQAPTQISSRRRIVPGIVLFCVVAALVGFAMFFKPGIVGFATLDTQTFTEVIGASFTNNASYDARLQKAPLSLKLSGYISGLGSAKVYLVKGEERILVFDSNRTSGRTFDSVCIDSCSLSGIGRTVTLKIEVENVVFTLSKITYTSDISSNQAPEWTGSGYWFNIPANQETRIYLNEYFTDPDGDELVFISTRTDGLDVSVNGNVVTLKPAEGATGVKDLTFIASDLITIKRAHVQIQIGA